MATTITQEPLYTTLPVGQDIIFTVSNPAVTYKYNAKFIAEVFMSSVPPDLTLTTDLIGTFKTTPNAVGVGIFDFSPVVETKVKSDNLAADSSSYKTTLVTPTSDPVPPLHLIDKFSDNINAMKYLVIRFSMEGSNTPTGIPILVQGSERSSDQYKIFNGYLNYSNKLDTVDNDFGLDISSTSATPIKLGAAASSFLTNAPTTQYANIDDYGTVGVLCPSFLTDLQNITFNYYNSAGGSLGSEDIQANLSASSDLKFHLLYIGCFPANLKNWSTTFATAIGLGLSYYTVQAFDPSRDPISQLYTINVNCANLKNYVPIRLAWLNQWGAWDYYTFTKKSSRTISTQGSTYTQLKGTWNEAAFRLNGYRGGKKAFRVNATEKIKMNTDFVNESESEWFEELINSPEVYMLEGFQTDSASAMLNTYITPVRLTTSSYTRKTIANDRLMQYTFEVEKAKTFRTQAI